MHEKTTDFIEKLKDINSKEELTTFVQIRHSEFKDSLLKDGIRFYDEDSLWADGIIGNQVISAETFNAFEELCFIKNGIVGNWIVKLNDTEKFIAIKNEITSIIDKLE